MADSLEAKICVLGAQGVGKTSLVNRYCHNRPPNPATPSTVGANFVTKRCVDADTGRSLKLQIWDTAGQERFRSIARLYYRGASAVLLVYSIANARSFADLKSWMAEVREQLPDDVVVHVVGTMSDVVAKDPESREVEMEEVIAYAASHLAGGSSGGMERSISRRGRISGMTTAVNGTPVGSLGAMSALAQGRKPPSGSGVNFGWEQELGWDVCHEVSAASGEGVDEVFRVLTRKLVDAETRRVEREAALTAMTPYSEVSAGPHTTSDYFGRPGTSTAGSFRLGGSGGVYGNGEGIHKRKSWLSLGRTTASSFGTNETAVDISGQHDRRKNGCC